MGSGRAWPGAYCRSLEDARGGWGGEGCGFEASSPWWAYGRGWGNGLLPPVCSTKIQLVWLALSLGFTGVSNAVLRSDV